MMSVGMAQPHFIHGLRSGVANNVLFFDEQTVIFPAGNNCVWFNFEQKVQKFIPGIERSHRMHALALSPNRRYLAVSEKGEKATITVYDLLREHSKKKKVLSGGDEPVQEFVCMSFSSDSKYLIGQSGDPDWNLFYWMWEKQKVIATIKTSGITNPVYQVSFNPKDNNQLCVSGNGVFKFFRYADGVLKQSNHHKQEPQNFLSHIWLSDMRVIAGTETGKLLVFDSGDLHWEISVTQKDSDQKRIKTLAQDHGRSTKNQNEPSVTELHRVTAIHAYSNGFLCSAGQGTVFLFEKTEEKEGYRKLREIRIPQDQWSNEPNMAEQQEIVSLSISPSEEILVASTDQGQLYSIHLSLVEIGKGDLAHFEFLTHSFHSDIITGLSVCLHKPLVATCSLDKSVRIWNFEFNSLELYKGFQEEAYSIALHPSGLYILVGFADKLRLMNLLIDDIRTFREFSIRGCRECAFSHGGHVFAAVNANLIHIYSNITFENLLNLKGHNGKVSSIVWSDDDSKLVSCGMDGAIYEWNSFSGSRLSESVLKTCSYSCVTMSPDKTSVFAVGMDCTLKEIQDSQILKVVSAEDVAYTAIAMGHSGQTLFTGTSAGTIRVIKYPLAMQKEWLEFQAHAAQVTKIVVTYDDQYLVSVADDNCLLIWKITHREDHMKKAKEFYYTEEILITKSDLEEKNQVMLELKTRVEELKMENEYQLQLREMNYSEKMKELSEKFIQQIKFLETEKQILIAEKKNLEVSHHYVVDEMIEKHTKQQEDLESNNNQKLLLEYQKYHELILKMQNTQEEHERQMRTMEESKKQELEHLAFTYDAKLQEKELLLAQYQDESRQQVQVFDETLRQTEEDSEQELQEIQIKYEKKLWEEKETNRRLRGETGIMREKFNSQHKEIEERKSEIEKMKTENQKLQNLIKSMEKGIQGLKKEIQERDETVQDKEKRIYDLKKKNQELEKFKFVLDYKVKELKKEIEPRENDIKELKEHIQKMESELEHLQQQNTQLELNITQLRQKLKATEREKQREMQKVRDVKALVQRLKTDIHNCVSFIQEPIKLKETLRKIYECYVDQSDVVDIVGVDRDIQTEFSRQRKHLEQNVATLKKLLAKNAEVHRLSKMKIMKENVYLIKELNDMRQELMVLRASHKYESHAKANKHRKNSLPDFKGDQPSTITKLPVLTP